MKSLLPFIVISLLAIIPGGELVDTTKQLPVPPPLERAAELIRLDKPDDALEILTSHRPAHEEISRYHALYAQVLVQLQKPYESLVHYRLAYLYAETTEEQERLLLERAEVYAAIGYYSEASVCYKVFFKQYPKSSLTGRAQTGMADASYHLGNYRSALASYEKAGPSLRVLYGKANALQSQGKIAEARAIYHDLIETDPEIINAPPETLFSIGENHRQTGNILDARIYLTSVRDDIIKYKAANSLGLIARDEKHYDEAIQQFMIAEKSPKLAVQQEATFNRAEVLIRQGKNDEAEALLMSEMPIAPIYHFNQGVLISPEFTNIEFSPLCNLLFKKIKPVLNDE